MINNLLEALPIAVALLDDHGKLEYSNRHFNNLLNIDSSQLTSGIPLLKVLLPPWPLVLRPILDRLEDGQSSNVIRLENSWFRIVARSYSVPGKSWDGTLLTIEDYSRTASNLTRLSRDTIDDILFHIRSPLTAMHCSLSLLNGPTSDRSTNEQTRSILRILEDETNRLNILIRNLNALLLVDSGTMVQKIEIQQHSIGKIIRQCTGSVSRFAKMRNVKIRTMIADDLPDIACDEEYTIKAIQNILFNAVVFSPMESDVTILVRDEDYEMRVSIIDCGDGIDYDEHLKIFEKFYRGKTAKKLDIPGFGLGLYVAKKLIEAMDGNITMLSRPGEGSQFNIRLPLEHF